MSANVDHPGPRVRDLRKAHEMTLDALCRAANRGIAPGDEKWEKGNLSKFETCQLWPKPENLTRLAEGLGVPVWSLFPGAPPPEAARLGETLREFVAALILEMSRTQLERSSSHPRRRGSN